MDGAAGFALAAGAGFIVAVPATDNAGAVFVGTPGDNAEVDSDDDGDLVAAETTDAAGSGGGGRTNPI